MLHLPQTNDSWVDECVTFDLACMLQQGNTNSIGPEKRARAYCALVLYVNYKLRRRIEQDYRNNISRDLEI